MVRLPMHRIGGDALKAEVASLLDAAQETKTELHRLRNGGVQYT